MPVAFIKNWAFIVRAYVLLIVSSITEHYFSDLSGSIRMSRRKNGSTFEVIYESIQFLIYSYNWKGQWSDEYDG